MLATSASGSTVYAEPAPLVSLNNSEAALAAAEQQEEDAVLAELSAAVAKEERALRRIVSVAAALDVACARGRHAAWVGGVEPRLHAASPDVAAVNISNARHPLLLEKSLPKLPTPPLPELPSAALDGVSGPMAAVKLVPELWGKVASKQPPSGPLPGSNGSVKSSTTSRTDASVSSGPVPVDLVVPPGKAVVAVTGPNTGGKTASLKTLGLLCLMTKAGLFVPVALNPAAPAGASSQPSIAWFDRVLADVGDGQSLQQSLSTFSGHIRRVKGVLKEATPASLVLLDEVGSGTDPAEGAALAVSLLSHLAQGRAALVYATTHHSELKEVAATHPGFINASVEFDIKTLKPTYRLMWGLAGESNALAVAQGLGFDARVVDDARAVAARLQSGVKDAADKVMQLTQSLEQQHVEAVRAAGEIARRHRAAEKELHAAEAELAAEEAAREKLQSGNSSAKDATEAAKKEVQQILARVKAGEMSPSEAEALLRKVEQRAQAGNAAAMALAGAKLGGDLQGDAFSTEDSSDGWVPNAGDHVRVLKMGGAIGVVASAGRSGGGKVAVRVGAMTVEVRVSDLAPSTDAPLNVSNEAPGAKKASQGMADMKALREGLKAKGGARSGTQPAELGGSPLGVAVQTQRNTVNMRGLSSVDAVAKLEVALSDARPGSVLFAVHGVGTGRVRAAALDMLKRHPVVAKIEEAENSNGGCTVVYLLA